MNSNMKLNIPCEIYIMSGCAKNVIKNSPFGKQLIRLKKSVKNK